MAGRPLLAVPAAVPRTRDLLHGLTSVGTHASGGGEIGLPVPIAEVPALPVVDDQILGTERVEEAPAPFVFAVAVKLE